MKYNILRYENIGKYFKSNKAFDATIKDLRESAKSKQLVELSHEFHIFRVYHYSLRIIP